MSTGGIIIPHPPVPVTGTNAAGAPTTVTKDAAHGTKKYGEPLFGPSIGSVSSGPGWTMAGEKKIMSDELTPEIVKEWIEKSKQPSNTTTTLQALVNLKRPTLRLSPLTASAQDDNTTDQHLHLHGLEFTYDCDAPKCGIYVYVHLAKDHPDAPPTQASLAKLQVFDMIQDGGFGNKLTIEDGAVLELERFEYVNGVAVGKAREPTEDRKMESERASPVVSPGVSDATTNANISADNVAPNENNSSNSNSNNNGHRRRFSHFHFRRLNLQRRVSGPALAVVDAERNATSQSGITPEDTKAAKNRDGDGVRVTIRLVALDEQSMELDSPNEQLIYLHIVRESTKSDGGEDDAKPWVVKVVKREAAIGPHTFHLHEIYGLSSSGSGEEAAAAPVSHTYPPDASGIAQVSVEDDETAQSECLVCLSSPREVVLLPCRHLVACKECALNMVEFGAGGSITYGTEPTGPDEGPSDVVPGPVSSDANGNGGPPVVGAPTNVRRKRKAKGWFCPVCREPYTSMLRLTTAAPSAAVADEKADSDGSGTDEEGEVEGREPTTDISEVNNSTSNGQVGAEGANGDRLVSGGPGLFRSGFLRTLSGLGRERPGDIENQNQNSSSAA